MKINYSITIIMFAVIATILSIPTIIASEHTEMLIYEEVRVRANNPCLNAVVGHPEEHLRDRKNHALPLSESFASLGRDQIKSNILSVTRFISVNYSARIAIDTLWNIKNLERYEPKVISGNFQRKTDTTLIRLGLFLVLYCGVGHFLIY